MSKPLLTLPSGRVLHDYECDLVDMMHEVGFITFREKPFQLRSDRESHVYVSGREDLTDNPEFGILVGEAIIDAVMQKEERNQKSICCIGVTTAGTAFAAAASFVSAYAPSTPTFGYRIMREVKKGHGKHTKWVNGIPDGEHQYWLVENVTTSASSLLDALKKLKEDEYPTHEMGILIFVDRGQKTRNVLAAQGYTNVVILYHLADIISAFGALEHWPKSQVQEALKEFSISPPA